MTDDQRPDGQRSDGQDHRRPDGPIQPTRRQQLKPFEYLAFTSDVCSTAVAVIAPSPSRHHAAPFW